MNIENDVKSIIRTGGTKDNKAESISRITNFGRDDVLLALNAGEHKPSEIYAVLVRLDKK